MKILKILSAFVCGFVACLCWQFFADCGVKPEVETKILTLAEIQQMVGAEPDGIWGPETKEKWDIVVFNQYAAEHDYMYEVKK